MSEATSEQIMATLDMLEKEVSPFYPKGGARSLFYAKDKEILVDGPAGTGKTRACCEKAHLIAQEVPASVSYSFANHAHQ